MTVSTRQPQVGLSFSVARMRQYLDSLDREIQNGGPDHARVATYTACLVEEATTLADAAGHDPGDSANGDD